MVGGTGPAELGTLPEHPAKPELLGAPLLRQHHAPFTPQPGGGHGLSAFLQEARQRSLTYADPPALCHSAAAAFRPARWPLLEGNVLSGPMANARTPHLHVPVPGTSQTCQHSGTGKWHSPGSPLHKGFSFLLQSIQCYILNSGEPTARYIYLTSGDPE